MKKKQTVPEELLNTTPVDSELDQVEQEFVQNQDQEPEVEDVSLPFETRRDERYAAFYLCYAVDRFDYTIPLESIIRNFDIWVDVEFEKHPFAVELARKSIDNRDQLDQDLKPYLKNWRLERLGCCTRLILRLALWELQQPEAIPSIIINEAVELAKSFAEKDAYKFVNGVLDEVCKKSQKTEQESEE